MLNDLRLRCTMAMLMCLDRKHRATYVLGEVLEMEHTEAALILGIEPAAFRKQLSRARASVQEFTAAHCAYSTDAGRVIRLKAATDSAAWRPGESG